MLSGNTQIGKHILVVDDLPENAKILSSFLTPQGYIIDAVTSGEEALELVSKTIPDVILLDLVMPGMNGLEVCRRLKQQPNTRHVPVIIITGVSEREANIKAIEAGADDFLTKPFDRVLLQARIDTSIKTKILQDQLLEHQQELEEIVRQRTKQVELTQRITVFSLAKLAESRDNETGDHLERIRCYARELAEELSGYSEFSAIIDQSFIKKIYDSCPLHDIGKVGIPDKILLKPGKLTAHEFEIMKRHPLIGGDTLHAADLEAGQNSFLKMGRDIAYFHHERMDGKGYPFGLRDQMIPIAARITALADVYDALSSRRPYKEPFSHEKSKAIILEGDGKQFDSLIVKAFLSREFRFDEIRNHFRGTGRPAPLQKLSEIADELPQAINPGTG